MPRSGRIAAPLLWVAPDPRNSHDSHAPPDAAHATPAQPGRRVGEIFKLPDCIQWHCGEDTLWSASAPAPNFVWPLWSHSLCASGASPPQDCSSFPIPCKFHLYESTCCETIFRLLRARCSESHEPFEHRFGDGVVCWALLHKFLTKLLAWFVNLLCWQQQPAF